ncbi:toll/interleukin-1 receptor domain-containing protein [Arthrobacter cryoconiti]|uniref:Toll/interleukin-1 receptor domain-containing protein n=1 Tax=Arthrobacter cryoconiti TaxID=748907 RepID=A0ABV8QW91_9MICC
MKVFISWSGDRSKAVAREVKTWVKEVFQTSIVFMSDEDISAGTNWSERIKKELADTKIGIICLTPENQDAKWINFEMGALSKAVDGDDTRVIPLLIGFESTGQVGQPAVSFNMIKMDQNGFRKAAKSINEVIIEAHRRDRASLENVSDVWWKKIKREAEKAAAKLPDDLPAPRDQAELIEEVLYTVRSIEKRAIVSGLVPISMLNDQELMARQKQQLQNEIGYLIAADAKEPRRKGDFSQVMLNDKWVRVSTRYELSQETKGEIRRIVVNILGQDLDIAFVQDNGVEAMKNYLKASETGQG